MACETDLRPGGGFLAQLVDPNDNQLPAEPGCYLEIVPDRKLVWTCALGPGYRPRNPASTPWFLTAVLTFDPHGNGGCRYTATAIPTSREPAEVHERRGLSQGWGIVLAQLVEYGKNTPMG